MKASGTGAFKDRYPARTFDMGVAEQNMVAVAAGLAATGKVPFANSFTPFISRRACDQVAISVSYARRNVKLGGTDPGVAAELNGGTHMSFEDVGIMRSIPGMTVVEPVDAAQMKKLLPQIAAYDGPVYIRIFRRKAFTVFNDSSQITLGRAAVLREGADATIIATGIMVEQALIAVDRLQTAGISAGLVNMHTIKPLDTAAVIDAARKTGALATAENHNIIGGLGSAVAETIAEACPVPLRRIGVRDHFGEVGKKDELLAKYGMLAGDIVAAVQSVVAMKRERGR